MSYLNPADFVDEPILGGNMAETAAFKAKLDEACRRPTVEDLSIDDRIADLEQAVCDLTELVRHVGQVLSWTAPGQRLNNPPKNVRDCQIRLDEFKRSL